MRPGDEKRHRPTGRTVKLVTFLRRMFPPHQWVVSVSGRAEIVDEPDLCPLSDEPLPDGSGPKDGEA